MPPRSDAPPPLTASELALLARLEGRPLPRGSALEAALGLGSAAAGRLVRRLRQQGWLTVAAVIRPAPHACICISYLQIDWSGATAETLEDGFRRDPAILVADRTLGAADYRLFSRHADYRAASAWIRTLRGTPAIAKLTARFCATVHDRPRFAAARLAADTAAARRA